MNDYQVGIIVLGMLVIGLIIFSQVLLERVRRLQDQLKKSRCGSPPGEKE